MIRDAPTARRRLMIADDDMVTRKLLSMSMADQFDVIGFADDAETAVRLAGQTLPDVALIDVEMPKGGGPAAVRGILEVAPRTAIVMLSGDESDGTVRDCLRAGAIAYCRKGIDAHALAERLLSAIEVRAGERDATPASSDSAA